MGKYILCFIGFLFASLTVQGQLRIVTAGSSSSEIVCALGLCDKIVATDRTSIYPEKLQALPSLGYRTAIGPEGIIAQNPNLIILEKGYVKEELISQLKATGIKTLVVAQERNFASTKKRIQLIAAALDKEVEGEALINKIAQELAFIKKKVDATKKRPKVLCVYARGQGSMQVAGKNSAFSLVEYAGAVNAVPDIQGFKPLNTEALIKANPDYILFFNSGLVSVGGIEGALEITGVAQTTAGKRRQIIAMDGLVLTNWGPRIAQGITELFYLTHPEQKR